jgi:hypothetical protein
MQLLGVGEPNRITKSGGENAVRPNELGPGLVTHLDRQKNSRHDDCTFSQLIYTAAKYEARSRARKVVDNALQAQVSWRAY